MMKRTFLFFFVVFLVLVLEGLVEPSSFGIRGWGIDLDYCDIEWFDLETNQDNSVIFETAPECCILDSFVNYEGYSISSKGFLPIVVDVVVIGIKFAHSCPFYFTDS